MCMSVCLVNVPSLLDHVACIVTCDIHGLLCAVMVIGTSEVRLGMNRLTYTVELFGLNWLWMWFRASHRHSAN